MWGGWGQTEFLAFSFLVTVTPQVWRRVASCLNIRESSLNTTVSARGVSPPHPPFGHLLPVGEKGMARPAAQGKRPGPL